MSSALTLQEFLAAHPWGEEQLALGRPLDFFWSFDLEADPALLWAKLSDTSRFNRALGLGEMEFEERDGVLYGAAVNGGVRQEWIEVPWEWVAERQLLSQRIYQRGFAHYVRAIYRIDPGVRPGVCRLYVYFGWIPRGLLGSIALRIGMPQIGKAYRRVLDELVPELAAAAPAIYSGNQPQLHPGGEERIRVAREALAGVVDEVALEWLIELIRGSDDMDAYRLQVRRLAREWDIDERTLISTFLHATRVGLLELSWDVICPHCRGVREEAYSLGEVGSGGSCEVCDIDFTTDAMNAVEITFHIHPSIRDVPKVFYCSAEPAKKTHMQLQQSLSPGEERVLETRLKPGLYRMRTRCGGYAGDLDVCAAGESGEVSWLASDELPHARVTEAPTVRIKNDSDETELFVIEEQQWADVALRPALLFGIQEFRDLFSEEYLAAEVQLNVGDQAILFTDIVGSTRFYAENGDPVAFVEVKKHFVKVFGAIQDNHGAIIKTIGDAVMATFPSALDAVRAAREIHRRFPAGDSPSDFRLRISLHAGPCIAVNLNTSIDYFGGTVNLAAKLQACAEAGDIAMSRSVSEAPGVEAFFADEGAVLGEGVYESSALDPVPYTVWRTDVSEAAPAANRDQTPAARSRESAPQSSPPRS